MSSSFYPLGMNSYNNRLPQDGYKSSKGTGVFSNPTGVTAGNIRPLTNNDPSNSVPQKFGLPRPIKHYRKGISVTSLDNSTNSRQVKSSTGGGSLIGQMIDIPGGFSIKENPSNEISNTEELDKDCKTCQGVGIISDWQPITDLTEKPQPETQTSQYCCNEERNALRRSRSSNTKLKKIYYTSTTNYLYNRCQTFEQKQFNYLSTGNAATKPGAPLSQDNIYKANCNPNLEIQFTESQLPDGITLTPSNPLGCETVQYKPNNYKYGQQGAVSSSDRLLRLNVETIDTNRANIIKSQENLTKSKYFPNASGSENNSCCIIGSKAVSSFGTTILYITYPVVTRTFRTLTHRFSFPSSFSSISDPPVPVIQNEYILVVPSYELIDPNTNKVKMTLKYQLFTNNDAELLTVGLSFANNVNYYNQNTSIIEIIQFDGMPLYGLGNQFSGLTPEILISAPDEPRIINGTSALNCFKDCVNFNSPGIINWNIKNVVNMSGMFQNAPLFNQNLNTWDTSNVTNMSSVFRSATLFDNGQTGAMDISGNPFTGAFYTNSTRLLTSPNSKFLTQLSPSDVLIITAGTPTTPIIYTSQIQSSPILSDVSLVLLTAYGSNISSNQITSIKKQVVGTADLSWNTSILKPDLQYMFSDATYFNQNVSSFTVGNATNMFSSSSTSLRGIFNNGQLAGSNNNSLRYWNTLASGSIGAMFVNSAGFNQNISNWNVSNVVYTGQMFQGALVYNNGLAPGLFNNDSSLNSWNTSNFTDIQVMFNGAVAFNQNISNWDVSKVTNMNATFSGATLFNNGDTSGNSNQPLTTWYAPLCTKFATMFRSASSFNQDIPILVDSSGIILDGSGNGVSLSAMFQNAQRFNQNLNTWNTSKVSNMSSVFSTTSVFNNGDASGASTQPLTWITDNVTTMSAMFVNALVFNQPIDTSGNYWNTGKVTIMFQMLAGGSVTLLFNQPIGRWDVSNCTTMGQMFYGANKFNQNISLWKTGNVTTMSQMFRAATLFNQTINTDASGSWNVSKVTDMSSMFLSATAFNNGSLTNNGANDLSWNAPNCTNFTGMFQSATSFNQKVNNLVNTAGVIDCTLTSMFQAATIFNNGQIGTMDISGSTPFTYTDSTRLLTSTGSQFRTQLLPTDVLIITAGTPTTTTIYTSQIQTSPIVSDVSLVLLTAYGTTLTPITSIKKQVAGSAPLTWNTTNVKNMSSLFLGAYYFNQNINNWSTSNVTNMSSMFATGSIALRNMFNNGQLAGSTDVSLNWYAPNCTTFASMFAYTSGFKQPIPFLVDTSGITLDASGNGVSLASMFQNTPIFNQNLNTWNVSKVTSMNLMFSSATAFNNGRPLGSNDTSLNWYAPKCNTFASMFLTANSFNQPIPSLVDTSGNTNPSGCSLSSMFSNAQRFNQNINTWNVSRVTDMSSMFSRTTSSTAFNNGSSVFDASNTLIWYAPTCTTFLSMFNGSQVFTQLIPFLVDTSGVAGCSLANMFLNATKFNRNLNTWNVSRVTAMNFMFAGALLFNNGSSSGAIDASLNWYVPLCTTFDSMFRGAPAFNQPITNLVDTSGVTGCSLTTMFQNATVFNQNLNTWNVSRVTNMSLMFARTTGASVFNNGQTGTIDISGNLNTSSAFYTNSSKLLTCTGGNFTTLTTADVLIITTSALVYSSQIQFNPISDVSLVLLLAYGANITTGITSIKKQVAGTADLSWNTQLVTTTANMFQNATYFNQRLPWNMRLNTNVTSMFAGTATTFINLFNNGQKLTGFTQKLYDASLIPLPNTWDFSGGTITGGTSGLWCTNSRLIIGTGNGVTINPALT